MGTPSSRPELFCFPLWKISVIALLPWWIDESMCVLNTVSILNTAS